MRAPLPGGSWRQWVVPAGIQVQLCHRLGAPIRTRPHDQPCRAHSTVLPRHRVAPASFHAWWCPWGHGSCVARSVSRLTTRGPRLHRSFWRLAPGGWTLTPAFARSCTPTWQRCRRSSPNSPRVLSRCGDPTMRRGPRIRVEDRMESQSISNRSVQRCGQAVAAADRLSA